MSSRTDWVDYAKAIGIILVVYGHVVRGVFNSGVEVPEVLYALSDSVVYSFHMPLFFFLSGLFFYNSFLTRGALGLTLNKIDTVVYPYLIWSIFQGLVEYYFSRYTNGGVSLVEVFSLWNPRAQFWFLYALFFIFALSSFIFFAISYDKFFYVFVASAFFYLAVSYLDDVGDTAGLRLLSFLGNNIVYFYFGVLFSKHDLSEWISSRSVFFILTVLFVFAQYAFHGYFNLVYLDKGFASLVLAVVSILFVVVVSVFMQRVNMRILSYIGKASMAIYLMHILAGSGVRVVLSKVFSVDSAASHILIGCMAGVLFPLIALKVIEKINLPYLFSAPLSKVFFVGRLIK